MKRLLLFLIALLGVCTWGFCAGPASAQGRTAAHSEVIMLIDTSGSMTPVMPTVKTAADEFVARMPANLPIGLLTFAGMQVQPSTDRGLLAQKIDAITAGGETPLYDTVIAATHSFASAGQHILVILSDGGDTASTATLAQAVQAAHGVHVEAISLTTSESDPAALAALGRVTPATNPAALSAAFQRVANLLIPVLHVPAKPAAPVTAAPRVTAAPPVTGAPTPAAHASSASPLWLVLGGLAMFGALAVVLLLALPRQRVSRARLGINQPRTPSEIGSRALAAVEDALERHGKRDDLAAALSVAQIGLKPGEFVAWVLVASVVLALVGLFLAGPLLAVALLVVPPLAARFYVRRKKVKRQQAFSDQLPEVLKLVTGSLRSGFGLTQALDSVAEEAQEPSRSEFAHVLVESRLGRDLPDALAALAERMGSQDMEWVVAGVEINRDTGGNLSEVMDQVSETILERQRLRRQVLTLTAEGRLSARILTVAPLAMGLWQWRTNKHFPVLFHGTGLAFLLAAIALMGVGALWIRKLVANVSL